MRSIIDARRGLAALALGLLAAACAGVAAVERGLAGAEHALAAGDLAAAERGYARVAAQLRYTKALPWLLPGVRAQVAARRAAIRYWQAEYEALLDDHAAAHSAPQRGNASLRLVLANAAYRAGQRPGASAETALGSLDRAIALYTELLQDAGDHADAAFNYELLVRRRDALARGRGTAPAAPENPLGREGSQPLDEETGLDDVQIFVPLDHDERERIDDPTMGGDPPLRRRG